MPDGCTAMRRLSGLLTDSAVRQLSGSVMKTMNLPRSVLQERPGKESLLAGHLSVPRGCWQDWDTRRQLRCAVEH